MSIISWNDISPLLLQQGYALPDFVASGAVFDARGGVSVVGPADVAFELASVTKLMTSWAILIGAAKGAYSLESVVPHANDEMGPVTVRHLLAHASGLPFEEGATVLEANKRRVYSNLGIEKVAEFAASQLGVPFHEWVRQAILDPLGMNATEFYGSPAWGARSTVNDLVRFASELMTPALLDATYSEQFRTVQFPELIGIVPGYGRFTPSPWGLGCQIRGDNTHWLSEHQSGETFGHFGQAGSFIWIDPRVNVGAVFLGERAFSTWHKENWMKLNAAIGQCAITDSSHM